jgi:hypothetical protein
MPVNYSVKAAVVDLRVDTPKATDKFYVDTNAWFWTAYSKLQFLPQTSDKKYKPEYPAYLTCVLNMGGQLNWCGLSLSELAHLIEKTEYKIYCDATSALLNSKEYRHNLAAERARVVQEIQTAWQAVESMAVCMNAPEINAALTASALQDFALLPVDGYDLFVIHALKAAGITQVISDDGDFCCVPGITLFTANQSVIAAARAKGKFRQR